MPRDEAGTTRGRARPNGWRRAACRACDLLAPGCGMLLSGRIGVGAAAVTAWGLALVAASGFLCAGGVHPLQAVVAAGVVLAALEVLLALEPLGDRWNLGAALAGLAGLAILVAGGLVAGVGRSCSLVAVRDHCAFPGLLPGEVVLVRRIDPDRDPLRRGDLVSAATSDGPIIARVMGTSGDRVVFQGASVTRNDAVVPSTELGTVILPEHLAAPPEETRDLQVYEEELDSGKHPFFYRRGVVVAERSWDVPEGHLVLACDNRSTADALDSRDLGPLPLDAVIGRLGPVVWSRDPVRGVRLDRLGAVWR